LPDLTPALAQALQDRYRLERELGRGGMATVYLAHDLKHDRPVALKVLHPDLAAALGPERFQREIRFAARLQHPHILTVLDSGNAAGQLWFAMPFVEGESLRDRLQRERQLPLDVALQIAREVGRALDYAHQHGVIHRDIKPENVLLTKDGSTLVADFGIARALDADDGLTQTGMAIGTPAYMSPEQASAERTLDARTDVYSLGAVLYEMLVGEPPYTGPTAQAVIVKRFTDPVPSVRKLRPSVPEALDHAIQRALAPVAADRFATAADFVRFGYPLTATLLVGIAIGLGALFAWRRGHAPAEPEAASAGPKVLAVLPFENLGDSADAYFADGVSDEVRTKLAKLGGLEVIARGSSNEYRHTAKRPADIARELGADYLLTATVRWEKVPGGTSRVRVTPELVDVGPGHAPRTRWGDQFDAALTGVFQVQADIATKVASALHVALGDDARHELAAMPTGNLAAYDAFLKGEATSQDLAIGDPPTLRRAIALYEQAAASDSTFVPAWAQLARVHASLYFHSTPTPDEAARARHAAERAQALGPDRSEGPLALGDYYRQVERDNRQALAAYEAGLKLAPNNVALLAGAATAEQSLGRTEASLQHFTRAGALDPRSANTAWSTARLLLYLRRYPEAQVALERATALAPTNLSNLEAKVMVALAQGDLAGARAIVRAGLTAVEPAELLAFLANYFDLYWVLDEAQQQQLLTLPPSAFDNDRSVWGMVRAQTFYLRGDQVRARAYADSARLSIDAQLRAAPRDAQLHVFRGLALAYLGRKAEAIKEGERAGMLLPISRDATFGSYILHQLARIYLLTGESAKALDQLEPLLTMPYVLSPGWLRIDPTFAPLRGNPRFERLVAGP
jgi:serine/threonine-protein kinase